MLAHCVKLVKSTLKDKIQVYKHLTSKMQKHLLQLLHLQYVVVFSHFCKNGEPCVKIFSKYGMSSSRSPQMVHDCSASALRKRFKPLYRKFFPPILIIFSVDPDCKPASTKIFLSAFQLQIFSVIDKDKRRIGFGIVMPNCNSYFFRRCTKRCFNGDLQLNNIFNNSGLQ